MSRFDGRNQGGAHGVTAQAPIDREREACDALPPMVRTIVKGAYSQIDCIDVLLAWEQRRRQGWTEQAFASLVAEAIADAQRRDCELTYGPTHPNAGGR